METQSPLESLLSRTILDEAHKYLRDNTIGELLDLRIAGKLDGPANSFVIAIETELRTTAAKMVKILAIPDHVRTGLQSQITKRLVQLQRAAKDHTHEISAAEYHEGNTDATSAIKEPEEVKESPLAVIQRLAPGLLKNQALSSILEKRTISERTSVENELVQALESEFNVSASTLAAIVTSPVKDRAPRAREIGDRLANVVISSARRLDDKEPEVPSFLLKGMTIREALTKRDGHKKEITPEITTFLLDMVNELGTTKSNLRAALAVPHQSQSDEEKHLVARFELFEKRWNGVIAKLDRADQPSQPEPQKQLVLGELPMAKMDALFWQREALRVQEARAIDAVAKVREALAGVEQDFVIMASSLAIDTTRNFSWDKRGLVTYEEPANTSPRIRHKG